MDLREKVAFLNYQIDLSRYEIIVNKERIHYHSEILGRITHIIMPLAKELDEMNK